MKTIAKVIGVASVVALAGCAHPPTDPGPLEAEIAKAKAGAFGICYTHIHRAATELDKADAELATYKAINGSHGQPYLDRGLAHVKAALEARDAADKACHTRVAALEAQMPGILAQLEDHDKRLQALENVHSLMRGVTFLIGSSKLTPPAKTALDIIGNVLLRNPTIAEVAGHASTPGSPELNMRLSQARADAVRRYLIGLGVDGGRLTAKGYGETQPVADDGTREGRRANQRVELHMK